jgi:hypothetical protein
MTGFQFVEPGGAFDDHGAPFHGAAVHGLFEGVAERIVAEHANDHRRVRVGKRRDRPLDELREVEEEDRLDLVLARDLDLCARGRRGRQHEGDDRHHHDGADATEVFCY